MKPLTLEQIRKLHKFLIIMCIVTFFSGMMDIYFWYLINYTIPSYVLGIFFITFGLALGLAQYVAFKITDMLVQSNREVRSLNEQSLS